MDEHLQKLPLEVRVYEITGPLFFGAADAIEHIVVKDFTKCLVLRMRSVPAIDSTAMNALQNLTKLCESKGITLVFSHVNEQPMKVMKNPALWILSGKKISVRIFRMR
nr:sodium-independent anion transporter [Blautia sp. TF12-31AT]